MVALDHSKLQLVIASEYSGATLTYSTARATNNNARVVNKKSGQYTAAVDGSA